MRAVGTLLVVVVAALAVVALLRSGEVRRQETALRGAGDALVGGDASPEPLDRGAARRALARLERVAAGSEIPDRGELAAIARQAARWAAGSATGSADLTAAVALREAANALRAWALDGGTAELRRARTALGRARSALAGETATGGVSGVRDRLLDLQEAERERIQEAEEALR